MVNTFVAILSSNTTKAGNREALRWKNSESELDVPFTVGDLKRALAKLERVHLSWFLGPASVLLWSLHF